MMKKRWIVLGLLLLGVAGVIFGSRIIVDALGLWSVPPATTPSGQPTHLPPVALVAPTSARSVPTPATNSPALSPQPPATPPPADLSAVPPAPATESFAPEGTPIIIAPGPGTPTPTPIFAAQLPPDVINVVLLGSDRRRPKEPWRTDSIILVSIDRWNRTVGLLSIPRDLWVYIPEVGYGRINSADVLGELNKVRGGGLELVKRTIEYNLGFPVHRYARIDFNGFIKIIDSLGGVDIDVDCAINDTFTRTIFQAGVQHMDGETALKYARSRYTTSDFDRSRRQQKVLQAIWRKVQERGLLQSLPMLWGTIKDTVQTDIGITEMLTLGYVAARLQPQQIRTQVMNPPVTRSWTTPEGAQVLLANQPMFNQMLERFFHPPQSAGTAGLAHPNPVRVEVINASGDPKMGELVAANLERQGFNPKVSGVALRTYPASFVLINNPDQRESAGQLAKALGFPATHIQSFPDPESEFDLKLVVGKDYQPCGK